MYVCALYNVCMYIQYVSLPLICILSCLLVEQQGVIIFVLNHLWYQAAFAHSCTALACVLGTEVSMAAAVCSVFSNTYSYAILTTFNIVSCMYVMYVSTYFTRTK